MGLGVLGVGVEGFKLFGLGLKTLGLGFVVLHVGFRASSEGLGPNPESKPGNVPKAHVFQTTILALNPKA